MFSKDLFPFKNTAQIVTERRFLFDKYHLILSLAGRLPAHPGNVIVCLPACDKSLLAHINVSLKSYKMI